MNTQAIEKGTCERLQTGVFKCVLLRLGTGKVIGYAMTRESAMQRALERMEKAKVCAHERFFPSPQSREKKCVACGLISLEQ